ncbi:MAG: KamA family radical SAM protein [Planctomycetota bacterium]
MQSANAYPDFGGNDDQPPPAGLTVAATAATVSVPRGTALVIGVPADQWNDWRWQMRHRVRSLDHLARHFPGIAITEGMAAAIRKFPMAITPYYASIIRTADPSDPVYQIIVPQAAEVWDPPFLKDDPLAEDSHMPVPGLVHRYRDRALLLATTKCSAYCRHCTRKRVAGHREACVTPARLARMTEYLTAHPEIRDVVISGGDPFTMVTTALERVIRAVRAVPSVDIIRIGTRTPVVLPMRITDELVAMLKKYHPVYVNTHFNHPAELTSAAAAACTRLADAGIPVGNQTVLLRGVNDSTEVLADLFRRLVRVRVRPYYLYQCDLVRGVEHFRTPLATGVAIMAGLRGRLSGLAIPTFVVDAPDGKGKIPVAPETIVSGDGEHTMLRNFEGQLVAYPEPWPIAAADPAGRRPLGVMRHSPDRPAAAARAGPFVIDHSALQDRQPGSLIRNGNSSFG